MYDVARRLVSERILTLDRLALAVTVGAFAVLGAVLAVGSYLGIVSGSLFGGGLEGADAQRASGVLGATPAWLTPLGLLGLSGLMGAVVVILRRIRRTVELRGDATAAAMATLADASRKE